MATKEVWVDMTTATREEAQLVFKDRLQTEVTDEDRLAELNREIEAWNKWFKPEGEPDISSFSANLKDMAED